MSPVIVKLVLVGIIILIVCGLLLVQNIRDLKNLIFDDPETENRGFIRTHGDYIVWHNFLNGYNVLENNASVTLTTHGTFQDLVKLPELLGRWMAPISLTLYTNGNDFRNTIEALGYISNCTSKGYLMRRYLSIHLVFHRLSVPSRVQRASWFSVSPLVCTNRPNYVNGTQYKTFWYNHKLPYPMNLLRNVARMNTRTYYVMSLDIELLPSVNFPQTFLKFVENLKLPDAVSTVFCLPTFVHYFKLPIPDDKRQLLRMFKIVKLPMVVLSDNPTRQTTWLKNKVRQNEIKIFAHSATFDMCVGYVSINSKEPLFDERVILESVYDNFKFKTQILSYLNYDFIILDGAFLIKREYNSWYNVHSRHLNKTSIQDYYNLWNIWVHIYGYGLV